MPDNQEFIFEQFDKEFAMFNKTLDSGLKEAEKALSVLKSGDCLGGDAAFRLYDTFGFPPELMEEHAREKGITVDIDGYKKHLMLHQKNHGVERKGCSREDWLTIQSKLPDCIISVTLLQICSAFCVTFFTWLRPELPFSKVIENADTRLFN